MSRYGDPGDSIAVWNAADGNRVIVQYQLKDYVTGNYMVFRRGHPEPTIYRDVSSRDSLPELWYHRGGESRDWLGEPSLNNTDQAGAVTAVSYYDRMPRITELIDREDGDRVIASIESIGRPTVYVRGDFIVLVTYNYEDAQEVITLDRPTGRIINRWALPWTAEYNAGRMDLTGEHLVLIARPLPVTPTPKLFNTSTGKIKHLRGPDRNKYCYIFLSDDWFIDMLDGKPVPTASVSSARSSD